MPCSRSQAINLAITAPTAVCPLCGADTRRIHSRYTRQRQMYGRAGFVLLRGRVVNAA
jgi:hypothetical protein